MWVQSTSTSSSGNTKMQKAVRIVANDGHGNNIGHHGNCGGECILDGSGVASIGNFWHDDGAGSGTSAGIYLYPPNGSGLPASDNFTSTNDTVYNEGAGGGVGLGAVLSAGITKPAFNGFRAYDAQATPTMAQAFNGTCAADCTIIGSKIDAATVSTAFGGLTISGSATMLGNGPYSNYLADDLVEPGNLTTGGIGIFNGGARGTATGSFTDPATGVAYDAKFGGPGNGIAVQGPSVFNKALAVGGVVSLYSTQAATSTTSAGVTVAGGLGVAGAIYAGWLTSAATAFQSNIASQSSTSLAANTTVNVPAGRGKLLISETAHGLVCEWYYGNGGVTPAGGTTTSYCATASQANGAQRLAFFFTSGTGYQFQTTWTDSSDTFYVKNDVVAPIQ